MSKINIAGVDEVGRGAWAGPMVASAVIFKKKIDFDLKDSKALTFEQRKKLAIKIKEVSYWSIGMVSHFEIDKFGLQKANIMVAGRAIAALPIKPSALKLDMIRGFDHSLPFELIIRGDSKVLEIMAASIIAKDHRDNMMIELDKHYKQYSFSAHKGYGTKLHQEALATHGVSVLHRTSYAPIKRFLKD